MECSRRGGSVTLKSGSGRNSYCFLVVDVNRGRCPEQGCGNLPGWLREAFPGSQLNVQVFPEISATYSPDIVFLRSSGPDLFSEALFFLKKKWTSTPIVAIFCNGWDQPRDLAESFLSGLDDFLTCPFNRGVELPARVWRLLQAKVINANQNGAITGHCAFEKLVGNSVSFHRAIEKIPALARSDATALICGETGTGKELVAREIHDQSARKEKPFVPVNCGALPDNVFENELFGHAKGAFTDASSTERGLVGEAEGGTIFLDEVDSLSFSAQVKLLRFLQNGEYRPLGTSRSIIANVRIIAATNVDLKREVLERRFREDMYYRMTSLSIYLPPLRERIEDVPLLATYFLNRYAHQYSRGPLRLSSQALQKLMAYSWPGNVRELDGTLQRSVVLTSTSILQPEDIDLPVWFKNAVNGSGPFRDAKADAIHQFERSYLVDLLAEAQGNITIAARRAGKDRRTFQRLLQKYGLQRKCFASS
jgi:two-component system response regulator GlrR